MAIAILQIVFLGSNLDRLRRVRRDERVEPISKSVLDEEIASQIDVSHDQAADSLGISLLMPWTLHKRYLPESRFSILR
jgi:hypothetical protein